MKTLLRAICMASILVSSLFVSLLVFGQDTNAVPVPGPADGGGASALLGQFQWVLLPLTTVIIMAVKKGVPVIPSQLWPWIAPFIGAGLDWVGTKAGLWSGNLAVGAMFGGLATWFHQLGTQTMDLIGVAPMSKTP